MNDLRHLSDEALQRATLHLVDQSNRATADLIVHLIEVERRGLHLRRACSSMFAYCTDILGLSEAAAANRVYTARIVRRHPAVLPMLYDGRLHLSAVRALGPHLDAPDAADLLAQAAGKITDPQTGRRCQETRFLDLQHDHPYALGGAHSASNIRVFCRAHNQHAAREDFGDSHVDQAIASSQSKLAM